VGSTLRGHNERIKSASACAIASGNALASDRERKVAEKRFDRERGLPWQKAVTADVTMPRIGTGFLNAI
jgi:hypothetical protein